MAEPVEFAPGLPLYSGMNSRTPDSPLGMASGLVERVTRIAPGVALTVALTVVGVALSSLLHPVLGRAAPDAIVLSLVGGVVVRALWVPTSRFQPGIGFTAKEVGDHTMAPINQMSNHRPAGVSAPKITW